MKTALILGVSGQDGAYLAQFLLGKNYRVIGTSRDAQISSFQNLHRLEIYNRIETRSMSLTDFRSVLEVLTDVMPDEIYNLAGQSSVRLSFEQPVETFESISLGTLNLLEAIRFNGHPIKLYNAASSECFGETGEAYADENTPFHPRSPYAVAKATAYWAVHNYRDAYGLYACSGILFNHESPLRPERFVTQKIAKAAARIAGGKPEKLVLGHTEVKRDWGWAPEYVVAMWKMLQQVKPEDFVIATGETHSLAEFAEVAFRHAGLDWKDYVQTDPSLYRESEIMCNRANAERANQILNWIPSYKMADVARKMVDHALGRESVSDNNNIREYPQSKK